MDKQVYWIWLSNLKLRNRIKQQMLQIFKSPENIWQAQEKDLLAIKGIQTKEIVEIKNNKNKQVLESQQIYMRLNQIRLVTMQDKTYPPLLQQLYDKPICLYYKGEVALLSQFSLAIIGCREHTPYGATVASQIAKALGKRNITTVSGLARGIDSIAHRGSLQTNRKNNCCDRKRI
ncbi:MAG: DNA-processing protein DprA [Clostridia bacterium]